MTIPLRPKLRSLEILPVGPKEGLLFTLRDPEGFGQMVVMPYGAVVLAALMDGQHTLSEIQAVFQQQTGASAPLADVEQVIRRLDDAYLLGRIDHIRNAIDGEETWVRAAMGGALIGIGKRNKKLNQAAIRAAKAIGPIDYGDDNSCEPLDVLKHLTSDHLQKKLNG